MKKQLKRLLILSLFTIITFSINSCYNDYGLTTQDYDLVSTFFKKGVDFKKFQTFTLLDTVMRVTNDGEDPSNVDTRYDNQILNDIERNIKNFGYSQIRQEDVDSTNLPSVVILVSSVSSTNYAYSPGYWWGYWGWYPGWSYYPGYGSGWGGYYPWYPGGTVYSYTTGSIFIEMVDPTDIDTENRRVNLQWGAGINGLTDDSSQNLSRRIKEAIDQSFKQSPYLRIN
ncbi:MAG: DUF4136 domain-containing protein [Ignavibacteria bacterium]|nr:DUF4136 domain-containing protein [Ignavibacteria bacterium]MBT8381240.1 DUF4136 domain-containing protein [Ignavibacteria bacterium]MBT8392310.1 DUF4136 domain-containing protein [Ignavibacteria bacterium]NNJ53430.1 DUF4136 domain-containing protein [Ignavibacteriaceae bacterium]NNL19829.1 DUF4136 domain-containing protein [Ignavibacteriaceae bacterium]